MTTVTRFAPSPTGNLHLGGARTALFNWLWARSKGGSFYLRLEDTDASRCRPEYESDLLSGLRWLGLHWDGEMVRQSERTALYEAAAARLLASGRAYWCACDAERLRQLRERSREDSSQLPYDGHCRDLNLDAAPGRALRLKVTDELAALAHNQSVDLLFGAGAGSTGRLEDFVLRRSDRAGAGGFGYHLCCVVDDRDMGITQIIRGADHLPSIPRQTALWHSLDWQPPQWMHLPLVLAEDGARLSKRHHALPVAELRDQGYLPEAVVNFLARLGWSLGDEEFFASLPALVAVFARGQFGRAAATQDLTRLQHLNGQHCRHLGGDEVLRRYLDWRTAQVTDSTPSEALCERLTGELVGAWMQRCATFADLHEQLRALDEPPVAYEGSSAHEAFAEQALDALSSVRELLQGLDEADWTQPQLAECIAQAVQRQGGKFAAVGMPLRLALTGRKNAPAVDLLCLVLGREQALSRLQRVLAPA